MKLTGLAGNLLLLAFGCAVGLALAAELVAWLAPVAPFIYQVDDACLMRLLPGATKLFRRLRVNGGERITVHVNALGLRGEEVEPSKGRPRIVVYGDSFVEAEFSSLAATFPEQLEARLGAAGMPAEVLNAGVVGYGTDQVSIRLEVELPRLAPDLVIVAITSGNDFGDLLRNKLFRLGPDGRLVSRHPVLHWSLRSHLASLSGGTALGEGTIARHWRQLRWLLLERYLERTGGFEPRSGEDVVEWSLRACQREYEDAVVKANDVVVNLLVDHYDADVALRPNSDSARYKLALMEQVLARIRDLLAFRRVPLLLVLIPDAIDVSPRHHFPIKPESLAGHAPSRLSGALEGIAGRLGIPYVSLFEAFRRARPERLYFRDPDSHWNDAGQELAARVTAETLLSGELPPPVVVASGG